MKYNWLFNLKSVKEFFKIVIALFFLTTVVSMTVFGQSVVGTITRPGLRPGAIAVYETGNKVFVADRVTGNLYMYNGSTLAEENSVLVGAGVSSRSIVVDEATGKLYAASSNAFRISVVNAATGGLIDTIAGTYSNSPRLVLDSGLGKVYALSLEGLKQINTATNSVTVIPGFGGGGLEEVAVNPVTHKVFVTKYIGNTMVIVDGVTLDTTIVPGMGGAGIGVNWIENKVYVATGAGGGGAVTYKIYDADNGTINNIAEGNDALQLMFSSTTNRMCTSSEVNGIVTMLEGSSDSWSHVPLLSTSIAMEVCNSSGHIYYSNRQNICVVDEATIMVGIIPVNNPSTSGLTQDVAINQNTGRVYVVNGGNALDYVSVVQDVPTLTRPLVYLGSVTSSRMHALDPASKSVVSSWGPPTTFQDDHQMAFCPGSGRLYVPQVSSYSESLQVYAGVGSHALIKQLSVGGNDSRAVAFTPDGSRFYVTNSGSNNVSVINASDNSLLTLIPVGNMPWGVAVTPDGSKVLVTRRTANKIYFISTGSNTVIDSVSVGSTPWGIAVNPSGTKAYVANSGGGTVSVVNIGTKTILSTITVGTTPHWLAFTPDGKRVFVSNRGSGTVSVIDAGIDAVALTVTVGANPEGVAALPDGSEVYVVNSNLSAASSLSVINTADFSTTTVTLPSTSIKTIPIAIADPTSKFAGSILAGGLSAEGVIVRALQSGVEKGRAISNAAGDYCIFNLMPGMYDVEATALNNSPQLATGQSVTAGRTTLREFVFDNPLPIQLANFTATAVNQFQVQLNWTTLTEINNYGFEIQKSDTTQHYQTIPNSFIPGHGTTNEPQHYSYIDSTVTPGVWYYRLKQIDLDGTIHYTDGVRVNTPTGVEERQIPTVFSLSQNYPNPWNPTTNIRYALPHTLFVTLTVYSTLGQQVAQLVNEQQQAGYHDVVFRGDGLASGVYFYRLQAGDFVGSKKLLLLK